MTAANSSTQLPHVAAASDVMTSLARELEQMRALGLQLEASICQLAVAAPQQSEWLSDVQQLDLLLQQMAALRDFLTALSATEGAEVKLDLAVALERITLHDVRARLSGVCTAEQKEDEFVMFDKAGAS